MKHLNVLLHVPSKRLTQDDLDTFVECVSRMACQQNKFGPIFLRLDNVSPDRYATAYEENRPDFIGILNNER